MNKYIAIGRFTKDNNVTYTNGDTPMCIVRNSIALERKGKKEEGKQNADFVPIVAFGKTAEFIEKYVKKGMKVAIEAHMQSGSFINKDGATVYTLEAVIDNIEFAESKTPSSSTVDNGSEAPSNTTASEPSSSDNDEETIDWGE